MRNHGALIGTTIDRQQSSYSVNDTILYALAVGLGADPTDSRQLRYVYEDDLAPLPTLALVIAYPGFWMREPEYGFDWQKALHAEEGLEIHQPLPASGTLNGETVIEDVVDRGADKGCFIYSRKELRSIDGKIHYATVTSNTLARGDGGFGGHSQARLRPVA